MAEESKSKNNFKNDGTAPDIPYASPDKTISQMEYQETIQSVKRKTYKSINTSLNDAGLVTEFEI